ncbi:MAG: nitroreductase family protein [Candidatus Micrarchaeota archaeon]
MEIMEAIKTRRSVRKFDAKEVSEELITKILEAGMQAPSAGNQQPWHFVVIRDKETLKQIPKFSPYAAMVEHASLAILVCGDTSNERYKGFWVQDCSAAIENMLLAIHGLGLGAVWTAAHPWKDREEGYKKLVGLPEGIVPLALIPIGYPAQNPKSENRFKAERVHKEKW